MSEFTGEIFECVIVESPYAGDVDRNVAYARAAMADCLARGEAPYASHLLYTQPGVLDDTVPAERIKGIAAGFAWRAVAKRTVVYEDLGITRGMQQGIDAAMAHGHPIEYRSIPGWDRESRLARCRERAAEYLATGRPGGGR